MLSINNLNTYYIIDDKIKVRQSKFTLKSLFADQKFLKHVMFHGHTPEMKVRMSICCPVLKVSKRSIKILQIDSALCIHKLGANLSNYIKSLMLYYCTLQNLED